LYHHWTSQYLKEFYQFLLFDIQRSFYVASVLPILFDLCELSCSKNTNIHHKITNILSYMKNNLLYLEYMNDYCNGLKLYGSSFGEFDKHIQQIFHRKYETVHSNCFQSNENNYQLLNCILHTVKYLIHLECCII